MPVAAGTKPAVKLSAEVRRNLLAEIASARSAYTNAKANMEVAELNFQRIKPAEVADDCDDATLDAWAEAFERGRDEAGCYNARRDLTAAEETIINLTEKGMRLLKPAGFHKIEAAFTLGRRNATKRGQLLSICLRFNP